MKKYENITNNRNININFRFKGLVRFRLFYITFSILDLTNKKNKDETKGDNPIKVEKQGNQRIDYNVLASFIEIYGKNMHGY